MNLYLTKKQLLIAYVASLVLISSLIVAGAIYYKNSRQQLIAVDEPGKPIISLNTGEVKSESTSSAQIGLAPKSLEELQNKFNKEYENKLTIVFFYDGYSDQDLALRHIKIVREALNIVEPFASSPHVATKIFTTPEKRCKAIKQGPKTFLDCDRKLVESFNALGIEHFKLVVLSPEEFVPVAKVARGKNSAIYIPTTNRTEQSDGFNKWLGQIFMHELGHSLGLRDEYARERPEEHILDIEAYDKESSNPGFRPAKPNCAPDQQTAKAWWKDYLTSEATSSGLLGIFPGCAGRNDYFYPVKGTLMTVNAAQESYGIVSEEYLRASLDCFYANKDKVTYPAGKLGRINDCNKFRREYPDFWNE